MSLQFSDTSPLPLQLQIESQVRGTQKLAYLPTATTTSTIAGGNGQSPTLDFYYLNYRPTYLAGSPEAGKIDFWMLTPEGSQAPATGSLELFDEFGKIRLATLVEEGTEIPRAVANQNKPFLWKTWKIPQTLQADFDFSEKFRIILKTSDHIAAAKKAAAIASNNNNNMANANHNNGKRQFGDDAGLIDFLLVKSKNKHVNSVDNASTLKSVGAGNMVVQDRQFRIKNLTATPGGKPNPAKLAVNSIIASPKSNSSPKATTTDEKSSTASTNNINAVAVDKSSNENDSNVQVIGTHSAASSLTAHLPQFTAFMAIVLAATMGASFF
ncbi:hypothetical protein EC957_008907 [Mortierella hygrophila]|uniref:Uncharacterized protein n=1 Tax=Mortierella hygrophila TaxID=979708 RepID=A0A9P6FAT5_9FUNG|nr:hypothetical protein EC957_008907 [Mortierella hygrophila]